MAVAGRFPSSRAWVCVGASAGLCLHAQDRDVDLGNLASLLKTQVVSASRTPMSLEEAPGIVTLITRREIQDSGVKDLQDLLRLVPGFEVVSDTQANLTVGFRGNWGNNGKVLVLVDGLPQNDLLYGSLFLDNSFPLENVERVEIVRGPGSALHGGFGEIAVVNILTRRGWGMGGPAASYGAIGRSHRNAFAGLGEKIDGFEFSLAWHGREGNRSNRTFTHRTGIPIDMADHAWTDDRQVNAAASFKGLAFRYQEDHVQLSDLNRYGNNLAKTPPQDFDPVLGFDNYTADLRLEAVQVEGFTFTPRLNWRRSEPWNYDFLRKILHYRVDRTSLDLPFNWTPTPRLNLAFGYQAYRDVAYNQALHPDFSWFSWQDPADRRREARFINQALYLEAIWKGDRSTFTVGGRADRHSASGTAFAPRAAWTMTLGEGHLKVLAARAFRAPAIKQIDGTESVRPEFANTYEVEAGRRFGNLLATLNAFHIYISNPYYFDYALRHSVNGGEVKTRGLEATLQQRGAWGHWSGSLSTYRAVKNTVNAYGVPQDPAYLIGMPRFKATFTGKVRITERLAFAPSLVWISHRWGQRETNFLNDPTLIERPGDRVWDAFFHYQIPAWKLQLSVGAHNATNAPHDYVGGLIRNLPVVPGPGREGTVRAVYGY